MQGYYTGRVRAEVEHAVLASTRNRRGRKPRVDFAVSGTDGKFDLVVEAKWASRSPTLLPDILADIVRLYLLLGSHARDAVLLFAGERRAIEKVFDSTMFQPAPKGLQNQAGYLYSANKSVLPLGEKVKSSLRFAPVPPHRRSMYLRVLESFIGVPVPNLVHVIRSGPFPRIANAGTHQVYFWRVLRYDSASPTFMPENEYSELCETAV